MQVVLKIYENQFSTTPVIQTLSILDLSISEDVNGIWTCTVKIPATVQGVLQYGKLEVCEIQQSDKILFSGYVESFIPSLSNIQIVGKSEKNLLSKKMVLSDVAFGNVTAKSAINTLLTQWNSAYGETWSIECDIATPITKEVKVGDNFYDIFEEISWIIGAVWTCKNRVVIMQEIIGQDYTQLSNFKELVYNGKNPRENNIDDIVFESYGTISNVIIGDDGTTKSTKSDAESIGKFGALAEYKSFRTGSIAEQTQSYLDSKKSAQYVFRIKTNNFNAEIGDKVFLRIENISTYFSYLGSAIVNTKTTKIENGTKRCEYTVSDKYVYAPWLGKRLADIESTINTNRLG